MSVKAKASLTVISPDTEKYFMYNSFLISEEAEVEWFYEDLQDLLKLTPKKDVLFIMLLSRFSRV